MTIETAKTRTFAIRRWDVLRIALGILLLTAAYLKLSRGDLSLLPQARILATSTLQLAAVEWELALGIWLLSSAFQVGAWIATLSTFFLFAAVSGYLAHIGVATCGCFGSIPTSPWRVFWFDLGVIAALGVLHPPIGPIFLFSRSDCRRGALTACRFGLSIIALFAAIVGLSTLVFGSLEGALARLRGDAISVSPSYVDFGIVEPGQVLERKLLVQNWTDKPVRLIGATVHGPCSMTDGMPMQIPKGEMCEITVRLRVGGWSNGTFLTRGEIWSDADESRPMPVMVGCRVRSSGVASSVSNP